MGLSQDHKVYILWRGRLPGATDASGSTGTSGESELTSFWNSRVPRLRGPSPRILIVGTFAGLVGSPTLAQTVGGKGSVVTEVTVEAAALVDSLTLDGDTLAARRFDSSDTASLLPGALAAQAGGVSSLPLIRGLGDDRIRTLVDGVPVTAACPMHMNPPLSYVDPSNVARIDVLPGVTPVSLGGDSIGGTILIESPSPVFATEAEAFHREGEVPSFFRSNGSSIGAAASLGLAGRDFSFRYQGSGSRAGDYHDGDGERVNASRYETSNQQLTAAYQRGQDVFEVKIGFQYVPYEGFPNADMDLTGNVGEILSARYDGSYSWGKFAFSVYYDRIRHEMNGNAADRYPPTPISITSMGLMPTRQRAQDFGYRAKADIALSARDTLRIGNELHGETLDDRWPGTPIKMMFDYVSVNHATRTQLGTFVEWERRWTERWTSLIGVRNDIVSMNAGQVQGYDGADADALAFSASKRSRTDVNIDASALARYQPDDLQTYGFGVARKTRSPNFYERYAWGTNTMGMISWFGDGNGYTGTPSLKPETALTVSTSADWHGRRSAAWQLKVSPYFTTVDDYIGVVPLCDPACSGMPASQLQFSNHRARLYGIDVSAAYTLADSIEAGSVRVVVAGGFVRGEDLSARTGLYHMMPLNGTLALEHRLGGWSNALQLRADQAKTAVDDVRSEPRTPGFAALDLRAAYERGPLRAEVAIVNLLDRRYDNPLGGTWQSALYPPGYRGTTFRPLPAGGRSFDAGVAVKF